MARLALPLLCAVLVLLVVAPVGWSNHAQPTPTGGNLTFDHRAGNEWWIEVRLTGTDQCALRQVEARDDGGAWMQLNRPSWAPCNHYVGSFHIEPGHRVQFRALAPGSDTPVTSCWFTHPAGAEQCDTATPFSATFKPKPGNEWWVEVFVEGNHPIAGVDVRNADGPWKALTKRSWGAWAASIHIPDFSYIQFRARDTAGVYDFDTYAYFWPSADRYPENSVPDASFSHVGGNEWWIQTTVYSNFEPTFVQARVDQGSWKDLKLQNWGDYAAAINAPTGSQVRFRAGHDATNAVVSHWCYQWPEGRAVECDIPIVHPTWPKEGSFVKYETDGGMGVPGYSEDSDSQITLTFRDGRWTGTCTVRERVWHDGELTNDTTTTQTVSFSPPSQTKASPGEGVTSQYIEGCSKSSENLVSGGETTHAIQLGASVPTIRGQRGIEHPEASAYSDHIVVADNELSLVLTWGLARMHSGDSGRLVDTDAPIGPRLTAEQQREFFGTWPVEGSTVNYVWCLVTGDFGCFGNFTNVEFEYRNGAWGGRCTGMINNVEVNRTVTGAPPMGPATARKGESPSVGRISGCEFKTTQVTVTGTTPHFACCRSDESIWIESFQADQPTWSDKDKEAYWDVESRLVLELKYGNERVWIGRSDARFV